MASGAETADARTDAPWRGPDRSYHLRSDWSAAAEVSPPDISVLLSGHSQLRRPPVPSSVGASEANTADLEVAMEQMGIPGFVQAIQQQSAHEHQQVAHPALAASRPMP